MVDLLRTDTTRLQNLLSDAGYDFTKLPGQQLPSIKAKLSDLTIDGQPFIRQEISLESQFFETPKGLAPGVDIGDPITGKEILIGQPSGDISGFTDFPQNIVRAERGISVTGLVGETALPTDLEAQFAETVFDEGQAPAVAEGRAPAKIDRQGRAFGFQALGAGIGQIQAGVGAPSSLETTGGFATAVGGMVALTGNSKVGMGLATIGTLINMRGQRESARARRGQRVGFAQAMAQALQAGRAISA